MPGELEVSRGGIVVEGANALPEAGTAIEHGERVVGCDAVWCLSQHAGES